MFLRYVFRFIKILIHLLPTLLSIYRDKSYYFFVPRWEPLPSSQHRKRARKLAEKLAHLGPTFIKLGQILSTREDFIPEEYIQEMSKLQDRVPPVSFKKMKQRLDSEYGKDALLIFESIEMKPLATASLAQVHKAVLKGKNVALKILRPGMEELIQIDLKLLPLIGAICQTFSRWGQTNIVLNAIMEFSRVIQREVNFYQEMENIRKFRQNFAGNPEIIIPHVYEKYCTQRVLVLEYIEGTKISETQTILMQGTNPRCIVEILVKCYLQQVLVHGFFHADPHPGNLLISTTGKLAFLDFGMMVHFPKHLQRLLIRAAIAGAHRNLDELIKALMELGIFDPQANFEALKKTAQRIMAVFDKKDKAKGTMKIRYMVREFQHLAQDFSITLPSYLVYFFKISGEVEGLCMRFMPEFTGIAYASPFVKEMAQEIVAEEQKAMAEDVLQKIKSLFALPLQIQRLVQEWEEERVRVRMHPKEIRDMEAMMAFNARRVLFGILAGVISITTAILYIELQSILLLVLGFAVATLLGTGAITMPARLHLEWAARRGEESFPENAREEERETWKKDI